MPHVPSNPYVPRHPCSCDWIKRLFTLRREKNGYLRIKSGPHRDKYLHVVVWESIAGRKVREGCEIHHQNLDKECCCPQNFVELPLEFNRHAIQQHPYTGRFMDKAEAERLYAQFRSSEVPF